MLLFLLMKLIPGRIKELGIFNSTELLSLISTLKLNQGKASSCLWTLIAHSRRSLSWVFWPAWLCKGKFLLFLEQRHKVLLLWGGLGSLPLPPSGCCSLAGSCVLLVSQVLPALAAPGAKLISGHCFWLHLQGNFIHRQPCLGEWLQLLLHPPGAVNSFSAAGTGSEQVDARNSQQV